MKILCPYFECHRKLKQIHKNDEIIKKIEILITKRDFN